MRLLHLYPCHANRLMMEATSPQQARRVLLNFGADSTELDTPRGLQTAWRRLIKQYYTGRQHEEHETTVKAINDAYDVLRRTGADGLAAAARAADRPEPEWSEPPPRRPETRRREAPGVPPWAWAGHSGGMPPSSKIYRHDYRDVNYIKQQMWELSGHSRQEWTIWAFDGAFFRGVVTVYGAPEIFRQMAEAMVTWNSFGGNPYHTRAVFAAPGNSKTLHLLYADERFYAAPTPTIEYDAFNANPGNDQHFMRQLPAWLDALRDRPAG